MLPGEDKLPVLPSLPDDGQSVLNFSLFLGNVDDVTDVRGQVLRIQVDEGVHLELGVLLLCAYSSLFLWKLSG